MRSRLYDILESPTDQERMLPSKTDNKFLVNIVNLKLIVNFENPRLNRMLMGMSCKTT